jgi:hypothetical protein
MLTRGVMNLFPTSEIFLHRNEIKTNNEVLIEHVTQFYLLLLNSEWTRSPLAYSAPEQSTAVL